MKRRIISIFLLLILSLSTFAQASVPKIFSDNEIKAIVEKLQIFGIFFEFDDEQFFGENTAVKRYEAAEAVVSLLGLEGQYTTDTINELYLDVPPDHEHVGAISGVAQLGIMTGTGDGRFNPDAEITVEQFLKCIVSAIGYSWKAENYGGYPAGYNRVSSELRLKDGVSAAMNSTLTRGNLIRIVYNALDIPVCNIESISKESTNLVIDEDVTVLTEFHGIFKDEGVVLSNSVSSLNSFFEASYDEVLIGEDRLQVGDFGKIGTYFGLNVEYYYKEDSDTDKKTLLFAEPLGINKVAYITREKFVSISGTEIKYRNEDNKTNRLTLGDNVVLLYNGELSNTNMINKIANFSGVLTLIENNTVNGADIVIVDNAVFDKVESVDSESMRILGNIANYYLENYDLISITLSPSGETLTLSDVKTGDVIAVTKGDSGDSINIKVIRSISNVLIDSMSDEYVTLADGREIYIPSTLPSEQKDLIKLGATVKVAVDNEIFAVWVEKVDVTELKLAYLIQAYENKRSGKLQMEGVRLLDVTGEVKICEIKNDKDRIKINGKKVDLEDAVELLANIKSELGVGGDGLVSQVIYYKTDEEGLLTEIYTALPDGEGELYVKWNYKDDGKASVRDHGWGSGVYGLDAAPYTYNYALVNTHPVFQVPEENQESSEDNFFTKVSYSKGSMPAGGGYLFDSYVGGELEIVPEAMVYYKTVSYSAPTNSGLFVVDKARVVRGVDDVFRWQITGGYNGKITSITVKDDIDLNTLKAVSDETEEAGLTQGDVVWFKTEPSGYINIIEKIFDYETENIKEELASANISKAAALRFIHVYNAPKDSLYIECFNEDLSLGVPGDDKMVLFNFVPYTKGTYNIYTYDTVSEKVTAGNTGNIVDYLRDNKNYARILLKYGYSDQSDCIIYIR